MRPIREFWVPHFSHIVGMPLETLEHSTNDLTLRDAALKLGLVSEAEFDRVVDPKKMVRPYVAANAESSGAP